MNPIVLKAEQIRCLICDVDGVLTNGLLYIDQSGNELKGFNVQDGMGLKLLMSAGIEVAVITTSVAGVIQHRMKQLGIKYYYTGKVDKRSSYEALKQQLGYSDEQFCYIGDDLPDLPLIKKVGLGVAVANAVPHVRECADLTTSFNGGSGAVREICDLILTAQDKFDAALEAYLRS